MKHIKSQSEALCIRWQILHCSASFHTSNVLQLSSIRYPQACLSVLSPANKFSSCLKPQQVQQNYGEKLPVLPFWNRLYPKYRWDCHSKDPAQGDGNCNSLSYHGLLCYMAIIHLTYQCPCYGRWKPQIITSRSLLRWNHASLLSHCLQSYVWQRGHAINIIIYLVFTPFFWELRHITETFTCMGK